MNQLSKRIRKPKKRMPAPSLETVEAQLDDPEQLTACYANLSSGLDEKQFNELVSGEIINRMIQYTKHHNPQVVVNSLHAIQNLMQIGNNFGRQVQQIMSSLGLINNLMLMTVSEELLSAYLAVGVEIFETWDLKLLEQYYTHISKIVEKVVVEVYNLEIITETLNLLQIMSEVVPNFNLAPYLQGIKNVFLAQQPIIMKLNFAQQLRIKSLVLIIMFNVGYCDDLMLQLVREGLSINVFPELRNIEGQLSKKQNIEEEGTVNIDERLEMTLQIWECSAQSIIQILLYLIRIYEVDDDEVEDNDEEVSQLCIQHYTNGTKYPQLFTKEYIIGIQELIVKHFINYKEFKDMEIVTKQTSFTDLIVDLSIQIIGLSCQLLHNLVLVSVVPITQNLIEQIESISTQQELENADHFELLNQYLRLLNQIITKDQQQLQLIPQDFPLKLSEAITENEDSQFHLIELMKQRYSSKIINELPIIEQVTQLLLKFMNQPSTMLATQALDCLFDVYTEEDYNIILVQLNILNLLRQGAAYLKSRLPEEQKRLSKDDFKFVKLTVINLNRFIEYKVGMLK